MALEPQLIERFSWLDSTKKTLDSITNDHLELSRVRERVDEVKEKCNELEKQTKIKRWYTKYISKILRY